MRQNSGVSVAAGGKRPQLVIACMCVRVFREAAVAGQGVVGESHQDQCGASSDAGRWCGPTTSGQPPSRQSHFPKESDDARHPEAPGLCYSTGKRANGLALDISVWGG